MTAQQDALFPRSVSTGDAIRRDPGSALKLLSVPGIGSVHFRSLMRAFGSPAEVFRSDVKVLENVPGIGPQTARAIRQFSSDQVVDEYLKSLDKINARIVSIWDDDYPPKLKEIHDPPALLFVRGSLPEADETCIAVVGTRSPNHYGLDHTRVLAGALAQEGIGIVSGMARGIDSAAHDGALRGKGKTYAVFGCGVDYIYPPENKGLAEQIETCGGLISEFLPGTRPDAGLFPRRNRVISGLSSAVVVIQGGKKSGALITAKCAVEQNREVFALPGNVTDKLSAGPHKLIQEGAAVITSAADILEAIGWRKTVVGIATKPVSLPSLNPSEEKVARKLSHEPMHIDRIVQELDQPVASVLADLLSLEMKGWIEQLPGKLFVLKES
jgi:DNA processing protein